MIFAILRSKNYEKKSDWFLQDAFMFYGDISDNIRLLNPESAKNKSERAAAKFVQADKFIEKTGGHLSCQSD